MNNVSGNERTGKMRTTQSVAPLSPFRSSVGVFVASVVKDRLVGDARGAGMLKSREGL